MRAERHHVSLMLRLCSLTVYKARRLRHEHEADMSNRLANREHAEHAYHFAEFSAAFGVAEK